MDVNLQNRHFQLRYSKTSRPFHIMTCKSSVGWLTTPRSNRIGSLFSLPSSVLQPTRDFRSTRRGRPSAWISLQQTSEATGTSGISCSSRSQEVDTAEQFQGRVMDQKDAEDIVVLDMEAYFSGERNRVAKFCHQLREQCHTVGFFYVKNHGVSHELCHSFLQLAREFFELSLEAKMQLDYRNSAQFRGYMRVGVENTAGKTDFREQIDLGPEEAEVVGIVGGIESKMVYPVYRRLHGPNQWPPHHLLPNFRAKAEEFMNKMGALSMHLMQAIALSLGLRKDFFDSSFQTSPHYQMKVVRYPPKSEKEDLTALGLLGVGEHSDSGFLSLLLQDDVGGLQAQTSTGNWSNVSPKEGTFVVNLGEMLQLATGGYYLATVHRVLSHAGGISRYSVPFFFNPRLDTDIRAFNVVGKMNVPFQDDASSLRLKENGLQGGRSTHGGKNKLMPVVGHNVFKSFARSHPSNMQKHHADLLQPNGCVALSKIEDTV